MIGIVLVSHSEPLAQATVGLALQMAGDDPPPVRVEAGADDGGLGTDAVAIAAAIDDLTPDVDGVLVIPDLGSAVLSAELALDLRESDGAVVVGDGPFVEGAVLAVVTAAGGADLDTVAAAASEALAVKRQGDGDGGAGLPSARGSDQAAAAAEVLAAEVELPNPQGLHARPAAILARAASGFAADIRLTDLTAGRGTADASSVLAVLALGATGGHVLRVEADGADARAALEAITALVADGFGETS